MRWIWLLFSTGRLPLRILHIYNRMCSRISFRVRAFSRLCHARLSRLHLRRVRLSCRCRGKTRNSTALRMDERRGADTTFFRSLDTEPSLCSRFFMVCLTCLGRCWRTTWVHCGVSDPLCLLPTGDPPVGKTIGSTSLKGNLFWHSRLHFHNPL